MHLRRIFGLGKHAVDLSRRLTPIVLALLTFFVALPVRAQSDSAEGSSPVPILTGSAGFITTFDGGTPHLGPSISPVVLLPLGEKWLVESRGAFEADLSPPPGSDAFKGKVTKAVDYLQLDYIANPYLTVTVGRFLTPFGVFNERFYPAWIRNLQTDPLILPIGVGPSNASDGAMLRGGFEVHPQVNINYAAYFSTHSGVNTLDSDRVAGGRAGVFLPGPRLEIGGSFQHLLQLERSNLFGFHFSWQPQPLPLDIRGEYAHSQRGSGYWVESAYRLSQVPVGQKVLRHTQVVARMQQFYTGNLASGSLPSVDTNDFEFGVNYYFRDGLKGTSSYGRQFSPAGNKNVWTLGVTYRFAVALGHGDTY
jgi:hypothetical protein